MILLVFFWGVLVGAVISYRITRSCMKALEKASLDAVRELADHAKERLCDLGKSITDQLRK